MSVVLDVLRELICDPAEPIDPDRLYAARRALHDDPSVLKTSDIELLASEAHAAFNASLQKREGGDADEVKRLTVATHVRTFCLSVISASTPDVRVLNDLELTLVHGTGRASACSGSCATTLSRPRAHSTKQRVSYVQLPSRRASKSLRSSCSF